MHMHLHTCVCVCYQVREPRGHDDHDLKPLLTLKTLLTLLTLKTLLTLRTLPTLEPRKKPVRADSGWKGRCSTGKRHSIITSPMEGKLVLKRVCLQTP